MPKKKNASNSLVDDTRGSLCPALSDRSSQFPIGENAAEENDDGGG